MDSRISRPGPCSAGCWLAATQTRGHNQGHINLGCINNSAHYSESLNYAIVVGNDKFVSNDCGRYTVVTVRGSELRSCEFLSSFTATTNKYLEDPRLQSAMYRNQVSAFEEPFMGEGKGSSPFLDFWARVALRLRATGNAIALADT